MVYLTFVYDLLEMILNILFGLAKETNYSQIDEKSKPTLDFEAKNRFSSMANMVKIQNNDGFGIHLMANSDIGVGETVLLDEAFVFDASECQQSYCKNCFKLATCFTQCPNCSDMMFCCRTCMASANKIH